MGRKFIDCRETPSVMNCSIAISADSEAELIDAAVQGRATSAPGMDLRISPLVEPIRRMPPLRSWPRTA